jgi:hypothetical protein
MGGAAQNPVSLIAMRVRKRNCGALCAMRFALNRGLTEFKVVGYAIRVR